MESVKRYKRVVHDITATESYVIPHTQKCERVVDDSNFVPESEILKKLDGARPLTDPEMKQFYDFADGKDKGTPIPFNRTAENLDIAILTTMIKAEAKEMSEKVKEAQETAKRKVEREQAAKTVAETKTE